MASSKRKSVSVSWESAFLFPTIGRTGVSNMFLLTRNAVWKPATSDFCYLSTSTERPALAPVGILRTRGGYRLLTEQAGRMPIPDEVVVQKTHDNDIYHVVTCPSIFDIDIGDRKYAVFGCFGYCEENESIGLFNAAGHSKESYHIEYIRVEQMFDAGKDPGNMPKYSPTLGLSPYNKLAKKGLVDDEYHPADPEYSPPEARRATEAAPDYERLALQAVQQSTGLDPGSFQQAKTIIVVDGKLAQRLRKRTELEREKTRDPEILQGELYLKKLLDEARKSLKLGDDGSFPFPMAAKLEEPKPAFIKFKSEEEFEEVTEEEAKLL